MPVTKLTPAFKYELHKYSQQDSVMPKYKLPIENGNYHRLFLFTDNLFRRNDRWKILQLDCGLSSYLEIGITNRSRVEYFQDTVQFFKVKCESKVNDVISIRCIEFAVVDFWVENGIIIKISSRNRECNMENPF